jgi:hypothetical protein
MVLLLINSIGNSQENNMSPTTHFKSLGPAREELNELPRRKQRGINRNIFIAPRGGELILRPPQAD